LQSLMPPHPCSHTHFHQQFGRFLPSCQASPWPHPWYRVVLLGYMLSEQRSEWVSSIGTPEGSLGRCSMFLSVILEGAACFSLLLLHSLLQPQPEDQLQTPREEPLSLQQPPIIKGSSLEEESSPPLRSFVSTIEGS